MITVYGISNCDTIKKARKWLEQHQIEYRFHDYRKDGLTAEQLRLWVSVLGYSSLLNRRGTTWRQLPEETKENVDASSAVALMLKNPAMIKRPLLDKEGTFHLGFDPDTYTALLLA